MDVTFSASADQLTAVTSDAGYTRVIFQYDGQGRRVEKDVYAWVDSDGSGTEDDSDPSSGSWVLSYTCKFVYDGTDLVAELDGRLKR